MALALRGPLAAALAVGALVVPLSAARPALAADTRTFEAPPYTVAVTVPDPVPVQGDASFPVRVSPAEGVGLGAVAVPRPGTDSTPGHTRVVQSAPGRFTVLVSFPVRGSWTLVIFLSTPAGRRQVAVPVTVAAPGAIPGWLGWAVGLLPLLGLTVFLGFQVRLAGRLEAAGGGS